MADVEESSIFTKQSWPSAAQLNFMTSEMTILEKKGISLTTAPAGDGEWADDEGGESEEEEEKQEEEGYEEESVQRPVIAPTPPARKPPAASFVGPKLETLDSSGKKSVIVIQKDEYTLKYRVADDVFARLHESNRLRALKERGDAWAEKGEDAEEEEAEEEDHVVVPTMSQEEQAWVDAGNPNGATGPLKTVVDEVDSWEDLVADENATSSPCLLVNLSKFFKLPKLPEEDIDRLSDILNQKLLTSFEALSEELFEMDSVCFHSTTIDCEKHIQRLQAHFPECTIVQLAYPDEIDGKLVQGLWDGVLAKTEWDSVNELKACLAQTNKSLKWKFSVATEVRVLAESSRAQMKQSGVVESTESAEGGSAYEGVVEGMGLLDRLICMIFSSIPRELGLSETAISISGLALSEEAHYTSMSNKHELLRRLWQGEFGFLP
jgi:hypothetical protein